MDARASRHWEISIDSSPDPHSVSDEGEDGDGDEYVDRLRRSGSVEPPHTRGYGRVVTRRILPSSAVWPLAGLAVLGVIATVLSVERVMSDARDRDRQAVGLAAERVSSNLLGAMASLRSADVLAAGGEVSEQAFDAFATDVVRGSEFTSLAFAEPVLDGDRSSWEAALGTSFVDSDGEGGFVASPARSVHVVVRFVAPVTESSARVRGLDFMGDPVRSRAVAEALESSEPVVVGPSQLASSGSVGLFLINAVRSSQGDVVGYVAGGVSAETILSSGLAVPEIERLGLSIDGTAVIGSDGTSSSTFELGGRVLEVDGTSSIGPNMLLPAVIGAGTVVLWIGAATANRRQRRDRDRQRWISLRNARLADLAEQLGSAQDSRSVMTAALASAGNVIGADRTSLGRRDLVDRSKLIVTSDDSPAAGEEPTFEVYDIHDPTPLTSCVAQALAVVVPDRDAMAAAAPDLASALARSGLDAQVCFPLSLGSEESAGAIGFGFRSPIERGRVDDVVATAGSIAQLVGRALERVRVREIVQNGIDLLGELSRHLAAARSRDDIAAGVTELVPPLLGVVAATVAPASERPEGIGSRSYPFRTGGDVELHLVLGDRSVWNPTLESLTRGIVDVVDGAWSRAELYDHGRSVLQRLQETLLSEPPAVEGFEIAVAYRSAIEAVGIGGDWYSVIEDGPMLYAVIGDIAGHGPGAVALMAEVKTILRYLLSTGSSIAEAADRASAALERRSAFASAVLVSVDRRCGDLTYVNAGHPPPLLVTGSTVTALDCVHRPWLGVTSPMSSPTRVDFPVGALLLMYTDGLIEERGEMFDVSVARLRAGVLTPDGRPLDDPHRLTQRLIHHRATVRTPRSVDDDIALIAMSRSTG